MSVDKDNMGSRHYRMYSYLLQGKTVPWVKPFTTYNKSDVKTSRQIMEYFHEWKNDYSTCLNPFPHTTILQQMILNIFCQKLENLYNWMDPKIENLYNWMDNLWLKVENIVAKGEIARFEQFLLLSLCFQKADCCRGVRKRLYEGKG